MWSNPKGTVERQEKTLGKKITSCFKAWTNSPALGRYQLFLSSVHLGIETPAQSWWTYGLHRNYSTPSRLHLSKVKTRHKIWMMVSSLLQKISNKQEIWCLPMINAAALSLPSEQGWRWPGDNSAQGWAFQGDSVWKPEYVSMPGMESAPKTQYLWELSMSLNKLKTTEGWRTVDFIDHSLI